ncbi:MAG: DUF721 domain-containing protein [Lentisphaeria bacterium]|nr:DUF721 domain-containing protein [Lentisphaeria bacterium]
MGYRHHTGVYDPKYKTSRERREMEDLLSEWYGSRAAAQEITKRTEEPRLLAESLDSLLEQSLSQNNVRLIEMRNNWAKLIGPPLNKFTDPVKLENGTLFVETTHPAFLMELRKPSTVQAWLKRLSAAYEDLEIQDITFAMTGQTPREK